MTPRPLVGRIVRIDRGAIHDGPGVRTVIFFKGCPLRCGWCHSPETQAAGPELLLHVERCIACGACATACEVQAAVHAGDHFDVDRARCRACGRCVSACPTGARELAGGVRSLDEVMRDVLRDRAFYDQSGGGVTLSGGEALMQRAFALALLERCRSEGLHTAVETCGLVHPPTLRRAAAIADLFLFDLKLIDPERHRAATRASNRRILANLRELAASRTNVIVRVPLIPGVNDDWHNVALTGALMASLGLARVELLPYHRAGIAKYARLGRMSSFEHVPAASAASVADAAEVLRRAGLDVTAGGVS